MTPAQLEFLNALDEQSVDRLRAVLDAGFDLQSAFEGISPTRRLTETYGRTDQFRDCLRLLLERGATLDDPVLAPVLLDDGEALAAALRAEPALLAHRTTMVSTFTPLVGASLLHVAAEFGYLNAARVLVEAGAEVDARAAIDDWGLNGHTPLFHTVSSIGNHAAPIMDLLLEAGARTDIRLAGITWGKGFEWETTFFDVTPVSYAQLGLMPMVHRRERDTYGNIARLLATAGRPLPPLDNVPNKYLQPRPSA